MPWDRRALLKLSCKLNASGLISLQNIKVWLEKFNQLQQAQLVWGFRMRAKFELYCHNHVEAKQSVDAFINTSI